jgi:hypothetical protein
MEVSQISIMRLIAKRKRNSFASDHELVVGNAILAVDGRCKVVKVDHLDIAI